MLGTIAAIVALIAIFAFIWWLTPTDEEYKRNNKYHD